MKRELINKALRSIARDLNTMKIFLQQDNFEMYAHMFGVACNKADLLLDMDLISFEKHHLLRRIISRVSEDGREEA